MVEEGLMEQAKDEFQQIMELIANGEDFLLSGGAGSGKTHTLVQVIKKFLNDNPLSSVACITYTNAAVKEIKDRVNHPKLSVSTIHDFLWNNIKHFQKELKETIISLSNDENVEKIKIMIQGDVPSDYFDNRESPVEIQYKEYLNLSEGIISHDELLIIAEGMFHKHKKLCDIVKSTYSLVLIDEYQDTHNSVIKIFLEHFPKSNKPCVVGFFGDAMQSIYDNGVGNIDNYKIEGKIKEVKKEQNRRNPKRIIELANRLRTDGIIQTPSSDFSAPNMVDGNVKEGSVLFIHSINKGLVDVQKYLHDIHNWNFQNANETKELNLTHKLIADKAGFQQLMDIYDKDQILAYKSRLNKHIEKCGYDVDFSGMTFGDVIDMLTNEVRATSSITYFITDNPDLYAYARSINWETFSKMYVDKEQLLSGRKNNEFDREKGEKRDDLIRHLYKIQDNIEMYRNKQYNAFLQKTDYKIRSVEDKRNLKNNIEDLLNGVDNCINDVINRAHEMGICLKDDRVERFIREKGYVYERVKRVKFSEFQNLYYYVEGKTPFSTQHNTKGTEFDNVLVVLDNGGWRNYNFESLFTGNGTESVLKRTRKIFYVCCTRAKENLAIYYHDPSRVVLEKAKEWFGDNNIIDLDNL